MTERGAPVTALWPFLGSPGFLWVIDSDGNNFGVETGASEGHPYVAPSATAEATQSTPILSLPTQSPTGAPSPAPTLVPDLQAAVASVTSVPVPTLAPVQQTPQLSVVETPGAVVPSIGYGPTVAFTHTFPEPGYYKVWAEVLYRDQVIAVGWMLKVEP